MRDIKNDADCGKKTLAVVLGAQKAKLYHFFIISFSLVLICNFQYELNISSNYLNFFLINYLNFFLIMNSLGLFFHLFQVYKVSSPKEYDKYLKVLAFHAFLFSVLISFYFFKIVV